MDKIRILAVDDETSFTDLLKQYFEPRGYKIDVASDGNAGLKCVSENEYDVALLDLKMGGVNGDEIMKEIKESGAKTAVIFITAFSDSGQTKSRLIKEGAFAFLEKPLTSLKDLENLINESVKN